MPSSPYLLLLARRRVARGVRWLDERAKFDLRFKGWRLELMSIHRGQISSHVCVYRNTDDPLSLALKWCPELACESDYRVKWATVSPAFHFDHGRGHLRAIALGFHQGAAMDRSLLGGKHMEYCVSLNQAWAEALGEHETRCNPIVLPEMPKLRPLKELNLLPLAKYRKKTLFGRLLERCGIGNVRS